MDELKQCPFCGEKPQVQEGYIGLPCFWVECMNENCTVRPHTQQYFRVLPAIEAWNWRAEDVADK